MNPSTSKALKVVRETFYFILLCGSLLTFLGWIALNVP